MNKLKLTLILSLIPFFAHAGGDVTTAEQKRLEFIQNSNIVVKELGSQLKKELVAAIQEGGPINAIDVCNVRAPEISKQISDQFGLSVGRTALKVRNPNNSPDAWETAVLQSFEKSMQQGTPAAELQQTERVDDQNGQPTLRYMRAIATQDVCVMCHGPHEQLPGELRARLEKLYPADQAVGFRTGDLRGAFTVTENISSRN